MATFQSFPVPASPTSSTLFNASLAATTSTADILVGPRTIVAISMCGTAGATATSGLNIRFGNASKIQNAAATDFFLPPGVISYFDTGEEFDRFRLFNASASAVNYFVYVITPR